MKSNHDNCDCDTVQPERTWVERVIGTSLVVAAGILLLPLALPAYLYMRHLDTKYDEFCK